MLRNSCYKVQRGSGDAEQHLAIAERHVAKGHEKIARQQQIIDHWANNGPGLIAAHELMVTFESSQTLRIVDRDRLRAELSAMT